MTFETFGGAHLAIVAAVPAGAWALAAFVRRKPERARTVQLILAAAIALNQLAWYAWVARHGGFDPPAGLPLDLCDVVLWLTVLALAAPRQWVLELVYYLGLSGSGMAILTPDLDPRLALVPTLEFFLSHGGVVGAVLFLVRAGALRPRPGSWWRVFLTVNGYAAAVGLFNLRYGTNYMYLREKPASGSLLDLLGPWPWYLLGGEAVALVLLCALQLPFRRAGTGPLAARPQAGR